MQLGELDPTPHIIDWPPGERCRVHVDGAFGLGAVTNKRANLEASTERTPGRPTRHVVNHSTSPGIA